MNNILRKTPGFVSILCLVVVIFRTADFFMGALTIDPWLAWTFASIIEIAAVISAYWFTKKSETRWVASVTILVSFIASLLFNEGEIVRTLSKSDLVASDSNFLGFKAKYILIVYQWFGLAYGALPTLLATGMAAVQARLDGVQLSPFVKGKKQAYNWKKLPDDEKKKLAAMKPTPAKVRELYPGIGNKVSELWSKDYIPKFALSLIKRGKKKGRRK